MRLLSACCLVLLLAACGAPPPGPYHGTDLSGVSYGRTLDLEDVQGRPVTLGDFRGDYVLMSFGYTHCPEVCPTSLLKATQVRRALADEVPLRIVFVTVDPRRDTGAILADYVGAFGPDIVALRGDDMQTRLVAQAFRVTYREVPTSSSYAMDHTMVNYLIGPDGRLRLAFQYDQPAAEIVEDIRHLVGASHADG
ncbi:SCO family protein [Lysobacteraceae bacterium NML93-0792]|nr:SCO family protein [Xanthomonadaceae bacterium NML93-0792]PBS15688.1 SCO family protein [Xanthomonadaceae bacterium NML93-0793]PBS18603.1 SCO family protein [Xanthomonadaceae bacterium NML93-0831]